MRIQTDFSKRKSIHVSNFLTKNRTLKINTMRGQQLIYSYVKLATGFY